MKKPVLCIAAGALLILAALEAHGIITRHDREDARYLELGAKFPAVGYLGRAGDVTLVAPDWVVTAAHVAAGSSARAVTFDGVEYPIARKVIHPDWREMQPHDIALIQLQRPVEGIAPLPLYQGRDEAGRAIVFVGHGGTGNGQTGPQREDRKRRAATNKIDRVDEDWLHFTFNGPESATDLEGISGPGDSGGPALVEVNGKYFVAGVSVWGQPGRDGRGTYGAKEGYTRVSTHHDWLMKVLSGK
jgi:hypothetical protein